MTTYFAFLRGINVGAHNRMKMAELCDLCESLGFENVQTHGQSGNVAFEAAETDPRSLAAEISDGISETFDYDITVMARTKSALDEVVDGQPFDRETDDDTKLYVTFLQKAPDDAGVQELKSAQNEAEEFVVAGREVYSKLRKDRLDPGEFTDVGKQLGQSATRRTWNVVTKVHALTN